MADGERVQQVLDELAAFGRENDAHVTDRARRMLNITPETGQLLRILVRTMGARRILEIGTSNGLSTLWLAWATEETDGHVETIDSAADKHVMARANFERAGLADRISLHLGRALDVLADLQGPYDLIFLDADRASYLAYLPHLLRLLRPGGLLVTDNVVSHAAEVADFLARLRADGRLDTVTVPVGNGEELTSKRPTRPPETG
jgi:predicted O-methyltransferase YrrM